MSQMKYVLKLMHITRRKPNPMVERVGNTERRNCRRVTPRKHSRMRVEEPLALGWKIAKTQGPGQSESMGQQMMVCKDGKFIN